MSEKKEEDWLNDDIKKRPILNIMIFNMYLKELLYDCILSNESKCSLQNLCLVYYKNRKIFDLLQNVKKPFTKQLFKMYFLV